MAEQYESCIFLSTFYFCNVLPNVPPDGWNIGLLQYLSLYAGEERNIMYRDTVKVNCLFM